MRFSRPSTGTILGGVALFVALGGTALAAGATVVNIADPTTPANVAHVNSAGALQTTGSSTVSGYVGQTIPKTPFSGYEAGPLNNYTFLISSNKATVALTRFSTVNFYANTGPIDVTLIEAFGETECSLDSSEVIGEYDMQPGQTFSDQIESPIVLKPQAAGDVWCLEAYVQMEGNPTSYASPGMSYSGYVVSGTLPAAALTETPVKAGAMPHVVR